jgi:glycine oxidase
MLITMETLIIGGGVIGLSIARELKKRGVEKLTVLERGLVGREASWAAAGILAPQVEADTDDEFFRLCFESNRMYAALADELFDETGIDVELNKNGTLYLAFDEVDEKEFDHRFQWQTTAGLDLERLDRSQVRALEPDVSDNVIGGLHFPDDGQVENRKLVDALAASAKLLGVDIREAIDVKSILSDQGRVKGVETTQGSILADRVVITTGAWTSHIELGEARLPVEVKPIRGQMICYRPQNVSIRHVIYSRRGYLVPRADGRLLAGATAEDVGFDSAVTDDALRLLQDVAIEIAPRLAGSKVIDHWAGLRPYSVSGSPFIGPVTDVEGLFVAVGHFRNGILLTPITARIIADAVLGSNNAAFKVNS